jgi:hypothetical protein
MSEPPRDEREITAALELHTPKYLPGVSGSLSFRRLYDKRAENLVRGTQSLTKMTDEEFAQKLNDSDQILEILEKTAASTAEDGSPYRSDFFEKLIAAAMLDDTKVDPLAYLMPRLLKLNAIHIRMLVNIESGSSYGDIANLIKAPVGLLDTAFLELQEQGFAVLTADGSIIRDAIEIEVLRMSGGTVGYKITYLGTSVKELILEATKDLQNARPRQ